VPSECEAGEGPEKKALSRRCAATLSRKRERGKVSAYIIVNGRLDLREAIGDQFSRMFAARITLPHFSVSAAISLVKSAGEPVNAE
jgi:hypothetical protein